MIIPVEGARKILGDEANNMTDAEIERLIEDMDVMARYALKEARKIRKEAALALAQLIYDIYKEKN